MTRQIPGAPLILGRRNDSPADQRYWTIEALGRLAPGSAMTRESVAVLLEVLKPEETNVSTAVFVALGAFGPDAATAVPVLRQMLRQAIADRKVWLAVWSAATLSQIAPDVASSREALAFLVEFLNAVPGYGFLHFKAAEALGAFGPAAAEAIPSLVSLLTQGPLAGRVPAATALGRIAPGTAQEDQAVDALAESLRASSHFQAATVVVIEALTQFGQKAAVAIPRLEELELSPNQEVRIAAQKALATLKLSQ